MVTGEADRVNDKSESTVTPANDEMLKSEMTSTDSNKDSATLTAPKTINDTTSATILELKIPNRRPPLVPSKLASVYANIYGGLYNPPFDEEEEEEEYDEVDNTSFYSNIRYTYDDDDDDDGDDADADADADEESMKSSVVSRISDSSNVDDSLLSRTSKNARPPLISSPSSSPSIGIDSKGDMDVAVAAVEREGEGEGDDMRTITINSRPPLKRTSLLAVDGFTMRPLPLEADRSRIESSADRKGVFSNIYSGLYNNPIEVEEEEEYDEVDNTSFYSNIRYTYDDDGDDDDALTDTEFQEVKSDLESKLQGPQESYDDVTGGAADGRNSVPYAYSTDINVVNRRPPLLRNTGILQIQDPMAPQGQGGINAEEEKEVEAEAVALEVEVAVRGQIPALQIPSSSSFSKAIHIVGKYYSHCTLRFYSLIFKVHVQL